MTQQQNHFVALPGLAISPGATTPNPGTYGVLALSSVTNQLLMWSTPGVWSAVGGGGGPALTTANAANTNGIALGTNGSNGDDPEAARGDHTHGLPFANASQHGAMSLNYAQKLDGIGAGADVVGGSGSIDNQLVRYHLNTGKIVQNTGVVCDDSNNLTGIGSLTCTSATINGPLTVTGLVDGRDVSADGAKLDGIAAGATNTAAPPAAAVSAPPATSTASVLGSGGYAYGNHTHLHGNIPATTTLDQYHGDADTSNYGFMTPAMVAKLNGIAAGATNTAAPPAAPASPPPALTSGGTGVVGTAGTYATATHTHTLPAYPTVPTNSGATPANVAVTAVVGTAGTYARENHAHAHGNHLSGALGVYHPAATPDLYGFMTPSHALAVERFHAAPSPLGRNVMQFLPTVGGAFVDNGWGPQSPAGVWSDAPGVSWAPFYIGGGNLRITASTYGLLYGSRARVASVSPYGYRFVMRIRMPDTTGNVVFGLINSPTLFNTASPGAVPNCIGFTVASGGPTYLFTTTAAGTATYTAANVSAANLATGIDYMIERSSTGIVSYWRLCGGSIWTQSASVAIATGPGDNLFLYPVMWIQGSGKVVDIGPLMVQTDFPGVLSPSA